MKIVFLGDTHFGARGDSESFHKYFYRFYDEVFFPYLEDHDIKQVIQFGDFFDRRKFINYYVLTDVYEKILSRFTEDLKLDVFLGNHDVYYRNTNKVNSLNLLLASNDFDNVRVLDEPTTVDYDGKLLDLIPWINKENYKETLDFMNRSNADVCCGHFEISGFDMHKGVKSEGGMNKKLFKGYKNVYSGHFHTPSKNGNIQYLGTPYEITWSDYGDKKGFYVFDTDTGKTEFIQNPYKMHHKIMYDDTKTDYTELDVEKYRESIIKIIIAKKDDSVKYDKFVEMLYNVDPLDISVIDNTLHFNDDEVEEIKAEDPIEVLYASIDAMEGDARLDKDVIKQFIAEIHHEALAVAQEK